MEEIFNNEFWIETIDKFRTWAITELPGLFVLIVLFFIIYKSVGVGFRKLEKTLLVRAEKNTDVESTESTKRINTLIRILKSTTKIVLWIIFVMMLLQKVGLDIGPILAGAGIIGLAIGFGAQELVRDFISGFFLLLENQIRTGDVAVINGTAGMVEHIQLRTTSLRDFSGTIHIFQNGKITSIANKTKEWSAMVFDIGVAYKEDTEQVMDVMREVGENLQKDPAFEQSIIQPIEIFGLDNFADSAIVIKARIKTKPSQQWPVGREYRKRLKVAFDERGIEIPFPHTTVYWGEKIDPLKLEVNKLSVKES